MKPSLWLRIAAGLYAFFTFGHAYGFNFLPSRGVVEETLFSAMRAYSFEMQGITTSHWRSYRGFGHLLTVLLVLMTVLCWRLARLSNEHPTAARPLIATLLLAGIAIAALSWGFFFTAPAITATMATLALALALVGKRSA